MTPSDYAHLVFQYFGLGLALAVFATIAQQKGTK
jgi:hypothetical protein